MGIVPIKFREYLLVLLCLIMLPVNTFSQAAYEDLKAALIIQFANNIHWQEEADFSEFNIGVLGSDTLTYSALKARSEFGTIHGKPFNISWIPNISGIAGIQILYTDKNASEKIREVSAAIEKRQILLITDQCSDAKYIMLNIVFSNKKNRVSFEINKANILIEEMAMEPELLLLGGTEIDVRQLYREIRLSFEEERGKVANQQLIIDLQLNEIREYHLSIDSLYDDIGTLEKNIDSSENQLEELSIEILSQESVVRKQSNKISTREKELQLNSDQLDTQNARITLQIQNLDSLKSVSESNENIISVQEDILNAHKNLIRSQKLLIFLFAALLIVILALGISMLRAYKIKKQANLTLEEKVIKRTSELHLANKNLENEISTKNKYVKELAQSEKNYGEIFNATNESILIHDPVSGKILDVNLTFEMMFGYTREESMNMKVSDLSSGEPSYTQSAAMSLIKKAVEEGPQVFEWHSKRKSGEFFWTEISLLNSQIGGKNRVLAVARNISERKEAENKLIVSEEKYRSLYETANDAIFIMDEDTFIDCNPITLELFGCDWEDIVGVTPQKFSPVYQPDGTLSKVSAKQKIDLAFQGKAQSFEWQHQKLDGTLFFADVSLNLLLLGGERFLLALVRDITEKKTAEHSLKESEEKFFKAFHTNPSLMGFVELESRIRLDVNLSFEQISGYSREELLDRYINDPILFNDKELEEAFRIMEQDKKLRLFDMEMYTKSGEVRSLSVSADLFTIAGKEYILTVANDITERIIAQKALKESEEYYRSLFENISDGIFIVDILPKDEFQFAGINPAAEKFIGTLSQKAKNVPLKDIFPAETADKVILGYKQCVNKRIPINFEEELDLVSGTSIYSTTLIPLIDENGKVYRILGVARDITEKKLIEHRTYNTILETEEKERSRIAKDLHDGLGPILSTIKLYVDWLLDPDKKSDNKPIVEKVDKTLNEAMLSLREISNNLSPHILENYGLTIALNSFIEKVEESGKLTIKFETNISDRLNKNIEITIYRIITECINNTLKYAGAKLITISISEKTEEVNFLYTDDGIGFNVKKALGEKRGMGLTNIQNRLEMIGGKVSIISSNNEGTIIKGGVKTTQFF